MRPEGQIVCIQLLVGSRFPPKLTSQGLLQSTTPTYLLPTFTITLFGAKLLGIVPLHPRTHGLVGRDDFRTAKLNCCCVELVELMVAEGAGS